MRFVLIFIFFLLSKAVLAAPQTTAKISKAPDQKESPWNFGYKYVGIIGTQDLAELTGDLTNYNEIHIGYRFHANWKLTVKPNFNIVYNFDDGNTKHDLNDLQLELDRGKIGELAGFELWSKGELFLPTGYWSRKNGTNGETRIHLWAGRNFNRLFEFGMGSQLRYYFQSNRSNGKFDEYGRLLETPIGNTSWRSVSRMQLKIRPTDRFELWPAIELDHAWRYDDPEVDADHRATTLVRPSLGMKITYLSPLDLEFIVEQEHDVENDFILFDMKESKYLLIGFISF